MAGTNPYAGGSTPSYIHTKHTAEENYKSTIKEPTKEQKKNAKDAVNKGVANPATPGYTPPSLHTKKEEGYKTKGNIEETRGAEEKRSFGDRNKAFFNNLAADVLGDRPYDYGNYTDSALRDMVKKNPNSADGINAQRELNKRDEANGMAKKDIMIKGADGEMKNMTFGTGNTLEDAKLYGDIPASEVPKILEENGLDPHTTTKEEASKLIKSKYSSNKPTTPTTPTTPSTPAGSDNNAGGKPTTPSGPTGKTANWTNEATEEVSPNVNLGEGQTAAETINQIDEEPRKTLKDIMGDKEKEYQDSIAATPEMKSIWEAYKKGDIDKSTRNYFIADAIAKFAGDMGNISHAQHTNNMWANVESGNQINPMENVNGESQWQDYLKTDWKEAQKQKWEGKKKRMESAADILQKADLDDYVANSKMDIMGNSKAMEMAEKNPTKFIHMINTQRTIEGNPTMSNMDKNALVDAKADIEQAQRMGVIDEKSARSQQKILDLNIQYYDQEMEIKKAVAEGQLSLAQAQYKLAEAAATRDLLIKDLADAFVKPGIKKLSSTLGTNY